MRPAFRVIGTSPLFPRNPPPPTGRPTGGDPRAPLRRPELRDPAALERLRAAIRRIEGAEPAWPGAEAAVLPLGVDEIDEHLPWGGLPAGALHEIVAADSGMAGTASAFSAYLAALAGDGPVLWCEGGRVLDAGTLHPPGCGASGSSPSGWSSPAPQTMPRRCRRWKTGFAAARSPRRSARSPRSR